MTDYHEPQVTTCDQPLFVLKYRRGHAISRIVCFSTFIFVFSSIGFATIALAAPLAAKQDLVFLLLFELVLGLFLSQPVVQVVDLLSFKEIRLYQDRVVRIGIFAGEKAIALARVRLLPLWYRRTVIMCHQDTKWFLRPFKCIRYYGDLADPKDAIKLKRLLAALSGRQVRELEATGSIDPWIKLADTPRVVSQSTLDSIDNQVLREYLEERKLNRSYIIVFIVIMIFCVLVPIILSGFAIRWGLK